jgi:hypothetical protein
MFKGLWIEKPLLERRLGEIIEKSDKIYIKVTTSNSILGNPNKSIRKLLVSRKDKTEVSINLLVIRPCYHSRTLSKRAIEKAKSIENIIASSYEAIKSAVSKNNWTNDARVNLLIKFYEDEYDRWRFYIFNNRTDNSLFLGRYEPDKDGADSSMYEIKSGTQTLCDQMYSYFEEIWHKAMTIEDFYSPTTCPMGRTDCDYCAKCKENRDALKQSIGLTAGTIGGN